MTTKRVARLLGWVLLVPLLVTANSVDAGSYDAEMVRMAKAIGAAFDQKQQIKTIAVLDFTDLQGTVTELGRFLAEELSANLVMGQKQFEVIDRANLKRLLDENKLSRSGLVDPDAIKRLGKMAGADALVTGTVTPLGNSLRVSVRIINTETARIVGAAQGDIDKTPEISELLRARVVESGGSGTAAVPSTPTDSAGTPARQVRLTYQDKSLRATLVSASFDKSVNQITLVIDFASLRAEPICLAAAGSGSIFAVDDSAGHWNLVRMVGIRQGETTDPRAGTFVAPLGQDNPRERAKARAIASWAQISPGGSHRAAIVLAPSKADSSLTLNLTLGLSVSFIEKNLVFNRDCAYQTTAQISIGFDGIVVTR